METHGEKELLSQRHSPKSMCSKLPFELASRENLVQAGVALDPFLDGEKQWRQEIRATPDWIVENNGAIRHAAHLGDQTPPGSTMTHQAKTNDSIKRSIVERQLYEVAAFKRYRAVLNLLLHTLRAYGGATENGYGTTEM